VRDARPRGGTRGHILPGDQAVSPLQRRTGVPARDRRWRTRFVPLLTRSLARLSRPAQSRSLPCTCGVRKFNFTCKSASSSARTECAPHNALARPVDVREVLGCGPQLTRPSTFARSAWAADRNNGGCRAGSPWVAARLPQAAATQDARNRPALLVVERSHKAKPSENPPNGGGTRSLD
jgi:hypothetical protein